MKQVLWAIAALAGGALLLNYGLVEAFAAVLGPTTDQAADNVEAFSAMSGNEAPDAATIEAIGGMGQVETGRNAVEQVKLNNWYAEDEGAGAED
jgi:hypothetical protein